MKILVESVLDVAVGSSLTGVKLSFLESLDQVYKFETIEAMVLGEKLNLSRVPEWAISDVKEFIAENRNNRDIGGKIMGDLTPVEFLNFWLHWNGVVGYGSSIVELVEALGWRPTWRE